VRAAAARGPELPAAARRASLCALVLERRGSVPVHAGAPSWAARVTEMRSTSAGAARAFPGPPRQSDAAGRGAERSRPPCSASPPRARLRGRKRAARTWSGPAGWAGPQSLSRRRAALPAEPRARAREPGGAQVRKRTPACHRARAAAALPRRPRGPARARAAAPAPRAALVFPDAGRAAACPGASAGRRSTSGEAQC
jgi:hypothetical protein